MLDNAYILIYRCVYITRGNKMNTECPKCKKEMELKRIGTDNEKTPIYEFLCKCTKVEETKKICPICRGTFGNRRRTGPTGNKTFLILVDACYRCGRLLNIKPLTDYAEKDWLDRYNKHLSDLWEKINEI